MASQAGFGKFLNLSGKAWSGDSTAVPLPLLQQMAKNTAIPQTVSTLTVSIPGSVTRPVPLWIGNDFVELQESLSYLFVAGSNTTFINTSGVTAAAQVTAATCYYMYVGLDTAGAIQYYPSSSAPSNVQGPFGGSAVWAHPGTTRGKHWAYTGFVQATTTVPALAQMEKRGFVYMNPVPTAMGVISVAVDVTVATSEDFSTLVPVHGVEVHGWATGATDAAGSDVWIGSTSLAAKQFSIPSNSLAVTAPENVNFGPLIPDSSGLLWAYGDTTLAAGAQVNITTLKDVV